MVASVTSDKFQIHTTRDTTSEREWEYLADTQANTSILAGVEKVLGAARKGTVQSLEQFQERVETLSQSDGKPIGVDMVVYNGTPELLYYLKEAPDQRTTGSFLAKQLELDSNSPDISAQGITQALGIRFVTEIDRLNDNSIPGTAPVAESTQDKAAENHTILGAAETGLQASIDYLQHQRDIVTGDELLMAGAGIASVGVAVVAEAAQAIHTHLQHQMLNATAQSAARKAQVLDGRMTDLSDRADALQDGSMAVEPVPAISSGDDLESQTTPLAEDEIAQQTGAILNQIEQVTVRTESLEGRAEEIAPFMAPKTSGDDPVKAVVESAENIVEATNSPTLATAAQQLGERVEKLVVRFDPDDGLAHQQFALNTKQSLQGQLKQIGNYLNYLNQRLDKLEATINHLEETQQPASPNPAASLRGEGHSLSQDIAESEQLFSRSGTTPQKRSERGQKIPGKEATQASLQDQEEDPESLDQRSEAAQQQRQPKPKVQKPKRKEIRPVGK